MVFRWLAVAVVALHLGYLAYLVVGGFLAWRWHRTVALHLAAVIWAVLIVAAAAPCPLTWLENDLRRLGGRQELTSSFIDTYVRGVFYPGDHEIAARALVSLVIAVSWLGLAIRRAPRVEARYWPGVVRPRS